MKTATLKQGKKLLELVEEIPVKHLQMLIEGGYISDLLKANVIEMNRDDFRRICGLLPVSISCQVFKVLVDYTKSLNKMIQAGQYDRVNNDITSDHFPVKVTGQKEKEITLFHFNRPIFSDDAIAEMGKAGYRPALIEELLALGVIHKELQKQFPIVALGSVWRALGGSRLVPYLVWDGDGRHLSLGWFGSHWRGSCRFAAVRNAS